MADGGNDEEPPDTEAGGHGGKDDGLDEEGNQAVDGHYDADLLSREAKAAGERGGEFGEDRHVRA